MMTSDGPFKELLIKIKRLKTAVFNFLHNLISSGISKSIERLRMLLKLFERLIIRTVASKRMRAEKIGSKILMPASVMDCKKSS